MENKILGIHHITAIAGDAKRNFDFYTKVLGLRFIKRTVNFDDPQTYHFILGMNKAIPAASLLSSHGAVLYARAAGSGYGNRNRVLCS